MHCPNSTTSAKSGDQISADKVGKSLRLPQKREWGTIHPKIDSETKPLRKPIFANHVSSYLKIGCR
jgi:hypothetical protein